MERPLCDCHGKSMHKNGSGGWRCAVRNSENGKRWWSQNAPGVLARRRERYHANPELHRARERRYYHEGPGKERQRQYKQENRSRISAYEYLRYLRVTRPKVLLEQRERILDQLHQLEDTGQ